jgi:hypothetical protein
MNTTTPQPRPVWRLYVNGDQVIVTSDEYCAWTAMNVAVHTGKPCHLTKDGKTVDSFTPWFMRAEEIHPCSS